MSTSNPSTTFLAPVDCIPALTSGRNSSGYVTGNEPKYTLDNDLDTYWKSNTYSDSYLYYDLGESKQVDAVVFWLHNYNESYIDDKSWIVSYSSDDNTYTPISTKLFSTYVTDNSPIVVDKFSTPVTARYWRITLLNFDSTPVTIYPEVSAVWFMRDYSLPWKPQKPTQNKILYHNNETITRSAHRFATPAGLGKQKIIQRKFIFTNTTDQWDNLLSAYRAAKGKNLPVIVQPNFDSSEYYALQFHSHLSESKHEHGFYTPDVVFKEIGFKRNPFYNKELTPITEESTLYTFNSSLGDSNNEDNKTWICTGTYSFERGILAHSDTVLSMDNTNAYILAAYSSFANFADGDFTIEIQFKTTNNNINLIEKWSSTIGWRLYVYNNKLRTQIGNGLIQSGVENLGSNITDNNWHYAVWTVNRTTAKAAAYLDGSLLLEYTTSVSPINNSFKNLVIGDTGGDLSIDSICITKGSAISADQVAERYAGYLNYGEYSL